MGCTIAELTTRMSSSEMHSWRQFYSEEPWGTEVDDLRFGTLSSLIVNFSERAPKKNAKPSDFFIRTKAKEEAENRVDQSVLVAQMKAAFTGHNTRISRANDADM